MKLNLGCGNRKLDGWVNCDIAGDYDNWLDLNAPDWAMQVGNGVAEEVLLDQVLEHLPNTCLVMENIYCVLKPGGICTVRVPFAGSYAAWNDPTHTNHFTPATFKYFERGHDAQHYVGVAFSKVETKWIDATDTPAARLRNLLPFRDMLCWFLWSMHDGVEARLTK
jgi:hypothetical protein